MGNYKIFLGILASALALISYGIYFFEIFKNKVKPHAFSWFIWALTTAIIFAAQIYKSAGPGAWMTGLTSISCLVIFGLSLAKGDRDFVLWDWIFLFVALLSLLLWKLTSQPTWSVILITFTDGVAVFPTLRKAYVKPAEESLLLFSMGSVKAFITLFALSSYSLVTWLYPAMLVLVNPLVVFVILLRKRYIKT